MPLYEYECQQCHRRVEKIQKFSDAPLTICSHCGGALERTVTAPAVQFKGSGWYKDLYSSPKPPAASGSGDSTGAATASSSGGEGSSSPASESKPAASPAPAAASAPSSSSSSSSNSGS